MAQNKINEWTNGINGLQVRAIIKETFEYLENLVTSLTNLSFKKYDSLEELQNDLDANKLSNNVIYLVPDADSPSVYNQYIISDNQLLELGNTEVDLTSIENAIEDLQQTVGSFRNDEFNIWSVIGNPSLEQNLWVTNIFQAINDIHDLAAFAVTWVNSNSNLELIPAQIEEINNKIKELEILITILDSVPSQKGILTTEQITTIEIDLIKEENSNLVTILNNSETRQYLPKGAYFQDSDGVVYTLKDNLLKDNGAFVTTIDFIDGLDLSSVFDHFSTELYLNPFSWDNDLYDTIDIQEFRNNTLSILDLFPGSPGAVGYRATISGAIEKVYIEHELKFEEKANKSDIETLKVTTSNQLPENSYLQPNYKYILAPDSVFEAIFNTDVYPMTPNQYIYVSFNTLNNYPKFSQLFFNSLSGWAGEEPALGEDEYYTFENGYHYEICINNEGYAVCAKFNPAPGTSTANKEANE